MASVIYYHDCYLSKHLQNLLNLLETKCIIQTKSIQLVFLMTFEWNSPIASHNMVSRFKSTLHHTWSLNISEYDIRVFITVSEFLEYN